MEELKWLQAEAFITIVTKHAIPINRAPGIATVITAKQIKQMGFRTLMDVLEIVPGFDVQMNEIGERTITARGLEFQDKIKVMIDGHSVNHPWGGDISFTFYDLVVENIKRIEIIRGPGSALHGQNAFLAVINIITKDTEDIDGYQWTTSGGSYDTQNYNMLFGKEYGGLKISGFFDYSDTEGFSEKIEQDIIFGNPGSQSPGRSQNEKEKTDLNLKLSYKNLEIKGKYMKKRREDYIGIGNALNKDTVLRDTYIFSELIYKLALSERLNIIPRIYYDQYNFDPLFEQRPDGFVDPFMRAFPDGIQGETRFKQRTIGFESQFNYNLFPSNKLTFGFQYEWIHQNDVKSSEFTFHPVTFAPLPSPQDFSHDLPFTRRSVTRQIWAGYLQDEWNITKDIDLTVGVRYDHFTRFGGTTNPRIGLIWRFLEDAHLKLLFATAFKAPDFQEMFLANNPERQGTPNLDPEKVNTYEIGLGYNFTRHISGNINYFFNRIRDRIVLDRAQNPDKTENLGGARVLGLEAELKANFGHDNYIYANYTFQDAEETSDRNRLPDVPMHKANLGVNVGFWKYANANLHTFISGPRPREDGDTRVDLPSYALVNLTLIGRNLIDNFEIRGSVFNLFDKDYEDPAGVDTVPTDYPQQGRSLMVELRFQF
jgi:iron complex outermembrane receptor protein